MASKVKLRIVSGVDFLYFFLGRVTRNQLTQCLLVRTAFFQYGVAVRGCSTRLHQTAMRGRSRSALYLSRPTASTELAPPKIMRAPRRPVKATRSRSKERSEFGSGSTRGQPPGLVC